MVVGTRNWREKKHGTLKSPTSVRSIKLENLEEKNELRLRFISISEFRIGKSGLSPELPLSDMKITDVMTWFDLVFYRVPSCHERTIIYVRFNQLGSLTFRNVLVPTSTWSRHIMNYCAAQGLLYVTYLFYYPNADHRLNNNPLQRCRGKLPCTAYI